MPKTDVRVVLRLRPPLPAEASQPTCVTLQGASARLRPPRDAKADVVETVAFSETYGPAATQAALFEGEAAPLVQRFLEQGHNALLVAHGVSNSGKSHTFFGGGGDPGLAPRVCSAVAAAAPAGVTLSALEVYGSTVVDLLGAKNAVVRLRDLGGRFAAEGAVEMGIESEAQAHALLQHALTRRRVARTAVNSASSRGHMALVFRRPGGAELTLVDMAGLERTGKSGVTGERMRESVAINGALRTLVACLRAVAAGRLPPFRETTLTRLLQPALSGSRGVEAGVVFVVAASPGAADYDEKRCLLKDAASIRGVGIVTSSPAPPPPPPVAPPAAAVATPSPAKPRPRRSSARRTSSQDLRVRLRVVSDELEAARAEAGKWKARAQALEGENQALEAELARLRPASPKSPLGQSVQKDMARLRQLVAERESRKRPLFPPPPQMATPRAPRPPQTPLRSSKRRRESVCPFDSDSEEL